MSSSDEEDGFVVPGKVFLGDSESEDNGNITGAEDNTQASKKRKRTIGSNTGTSGGGAIIAESSDDEGNTVTDAEDTTQKRKISTTSGGGVSSGPLIGGSTWGPVNSIDTWNLLNTSECEFVSFVSAFFVSVTYDDSATFKTSDIYKCIINAPITPNGTTEIFEYTKEGRLPISIVAHTSQNITYIAASGKLPESIQMDKMHGIILGEIKFDTPKTVFNITSFFYEMSQLNPWIPSTKRKKDLFSILRHAIKSKGRTFPGLLMELIKKKISDLNPNAKVRVLADAWNVKLENKKITSETLKEAWKENPPTKQSQVAQNYIERRMEAFYPDKDEEFKKQKLEHIKEFGYYGFWLPGNPGRKPIPVNKFEHTAAKMIF
ncbi:MAG: hypothetical protein CMO80_14070 [Verrucomicrobiales bacterium]|nr:hypothetical protein [Verrucomicrobiales bacterium]